MKEHSRLHPLETIWISGVNPVKEALRTGNLAVQEVIVAREDQRVLELLQYVEAAQIPLRHESRDRLSAIVGHEHHQGIALRVQEFPYADLEWILSLDIREREPVVILDCIQDPQNLGAFIRSACFLGGKAIIIPKDRSAKVTAAVIKVAAGATSYVPVIQVTNLARTVEHMKETGYWIMGLDVSGGKSLYQTDLSVPLGLVIGNEQKGLRPLVRKLCDLLVQIPPHGPMQSLNAAAAGAIALAEVQRQRTAPRGTQ